MKKTAILFSLVCSLCMVSVVEAKTKRAAGTESASANAGSHEASASSGSSERYGLAGCGLGTLVFKERKNKVHQVLAATTNGTSGNQTFGISTGTLNCEVDGVVAQRAEQEVFVSANYDTLNHDVAAGSGETLAAMASLMGCPQSQVSAFAKATQKQYKNIFSETSADKAGDVVRHFRSVVSHDAQLSKACSPVASL